MPEEKDTTLLFQVVLMDNNTASQGRPGFIKNPKKGKSYNGQKAH